MSFSLCELSDPSFKAVLKKKSAELLLGLELFSIEKACEVFPCPRVPPNGCFVNCSPDARSLQAFLSALAFQPSRSPWGALRLCLALCCPPQGSGGDTQVATRQPLLPSCCESVEMGWAGGGAEGQRRWVLCQGKDEGVSPEAQDGSGAEIQVFREQSLSVCSQCCTRP